MRVHISEKNSKLGRIPNISLPPLVSCVENPPCASLCYARKAYERYARSSCKPAWDENLAFYRESPASYFIAIRKWIQERKPVYFRWHVGGDIPDEDYLVGMKHVAITCEGTNFLAFSRRPWAWGRGPDNLMILRSYWLNENVGEEAGFKVVHKGANVPLEDRCPGQCDKCYACWHMEPGAYKVIELH